MNFVDNETFEQQSEAVTAEDSNIVSMEEHKKARPAFAYWEVGKERLQLKLITPEIIELEKKFRKNLISLIGDEDNIPPLTTMLQIIHAAATPWKHGIKLKDVMNFYDKYCSEGGTQLNLYVDIYLQVFMVSGFFSTSMVEDMEDSMERVATKM